VVVLGRVVVVVVVGLVVVVLDLVVVVVGLVVVEAEDVDVVVMATAPLLRTSSRSMLATAGQALPEQGVPPVSFRVLVPLVRSASGMGWVR
jgi:hypothetical protein